MCYRQRVRQTYWRYSTVTEQITRIKRMDPRHQSQTTKNVTSTYTYKDKSAQLQKRKKENCKNSM